MRLKRFRHTEITKKKMRQSSFWKGKKLSKAHRKKISKTRIKSKICVGKNNPMFGVRRFGRKNPAWRGGDIKKICLICKKETFIKRYKVFLGQGKFCSQKCYGLWYSKNRKGKANWKWKEDKLYPSAFNQQLKDRVRVRDNFVCQKCGIPELECKRRLDIHHKDDNKKNSKLDNLISLCQGCHRKITIKNDEILQLSRTR